MVIKSAKGTPPVPVEKIPHDPDSSGLASVLEEQENDNNQGNDDSKEDHAKDGHNSSGNDSGNINDTIQGILSINKKKLYLLI